MTYFPRRMVITMIAFGWMGLVNPPSALADTIIGEYTFEDCDKTTPAIYAQHCLEYDITLLGDDKGTIHAVIQVNGHQTSERFIANTEREDRRGLKLIFQRYIYSEGTKPYDQGTVLGWLDFDDNHNVTLIPERLTTLTAPGELENKQKDPAAPVAE